MAFAWLLAVVPCFGLTSTVIAEGLEFSETPSPVAAEKAFPNLKFQRPVFLTHAADGSNRVFVLSQLGKIHVFPNDPQVSTTTVFLDLEDKTIYQDKQFEEGLLGLAFHPKFKENGEFFVYYTLREPPHVSMISRFRVSKDDPNRADPASEQEVLRIQQPYWNHNGGTLAFGPDGYLYIGLGDGGAANDPHGNGQNLETLLGSILRIDIDRKEKGLNYAIPKDNPFVNRPNARPEIWAYGVRNIWRLAFDRETGDLWAGDVGQDKWEEIDIITRGGNYGWNLREGCHPFGPKGVGPRKDLIEPIWEYSHDVGKSITGGVIYRGQRVPELEGMYLYADFVSGKVWALNYDRQQKKVVANYRLQADNLPVMSFGEDEQGEAYFMIEFGHIYRFAGPDKANQASPKSN